jgi:hypothetical protein
VPDTKKEQFTAELAALQIICRDIAECWRSNCLVIGNREFF